MPPPYDITLQILQLIASATASRDLQNGVKLGILERKGDKRLSRYRFIN